MNARTLALREKLHFSLGGWIFLVGIVGFMAILAGTVVTVISPSTASLELLKQAFIGDLCVIAAGVILRVLGK